MWNKIKEGLGWFIAGLASLAGLIAIIKNEQSNKILEESEEKDTKLQEEIDNLIERKKETNRKIDKVNTKIEQILTEKEKALEEQSSKTPKEVEDFWNKEK